MAPGGGTPRRLAGAAVGSACLRRVHPSRACGPLRPTLSILLSVYDFFMLYIPLAACYTTLAVMRRPAGGWWRRRTKRQRSPAAHFRSKARGPHITPIQQGSLQNEQRVGGGRALVPAAPRGRGSRRGFGQQVCVEGWRTRGKRGLAGWSCRRAAFSWRCGLFVQTSGRSPVRGSTRAACPARGHGASRPASCATAAATIATADAPRRCCIAACRRTPTWRWPRCFRRRSRPGLRWQAAAA